MAKNYITYSIKKFNAMKNSLTFTWQTECPCPIKCNSSQMKGKMSHAGTGMGAKKRK